MDKPDNNDNNDNNDNINKIMRTNYFLCTVNKQRKCLLRLLMNIFLFSFCSLHTRQKNLS